MLDVPGVHYPGPVPAGVPCPPCTTWVHRHPTVTPLSGNGTCTYTRSRSNTGQGSLPGSRSNTGQGSLSSQGREVTLL